MTDRLGDVITLKGLSRHGLNRINNQDGAKWIIVGDGNPWCQNNEPCWKLTSVKSDNIRWIRKFNDIDFEVIDE